MSFSAARSTTGLPCFAFACKTWCGAVFSKDFEEFYSQWILSSHSMVVFVFPKQKTASFDLQVVKM